MALHQCDVLLLMDFFCFVTLTFLTRHASDLLDGDIIVAIGYVLSSILRRFGILVLIWEALVCLVCSLR